MPLKIKSTQGNLFMAYSRSLVSMLETGLVIDLMQEAWVCGNRIRRVVLGRLGLLDREAMPKGRAITYQNIARY